MTTTPFQFMLKTLAAYRLQRIVTTDDWPPSERFREYIDERFGPESSWHTFFTCPWCFGSILTFILFAGARARSANRDGPSLAALETLASAALVGIIAEAVALMDHDEEEQGGGGGGEE